LRLLSKFAFNFNLRRYTEDIDDDYDAGEESYGIDYPDERGGRSTRGGGRLGSKSERPRAAVVAR
jgi:hypothetical protein